MEARELIELPEVRAALTEWGTPLFVLDTAQVRRDFRELRAALPQVIHHYAVKALSHPAVLKALAAEGASFDIATTAELEAVLAAGATPDRIIHTHPHKKPRDIRDALERGVRVFVADSDAELRKLAEHAPGADVLARLSFQNEHATIDLSSKFGLYPDEVDGFLEFATRVGTRIVGFSYHVGTQNDDLEITRTSLEAAIARIDAARAAGHPADIIDIGGGFPVRYDRPVPPLAEFAAVLAPVMAARPDIRYLSEPGRLLAAGALHLVSSVVTTAHRPGDGTDWVFIDDGLYGGYTNVLTDHIMPPIVAIVPAGREVIPQTLGGPTCDSADVIARDLELPRLEIGDLLVAAQMGAYTLELATRFNGIPLTRILVLEE